MSERGGTRAPVVVAVASAAVSGGAVRYAASLAAHRGVALHVVHVMPDYLPDAAPYELTVGDLAPVARSNLDDCAMIAEEAAPTVPVGTRLLAGERVAALLAAVDPAGTLVLGHDPRPSLRRLARGSTVSGVAARAEGDVIVVPPSWTAATRRCVVAGVPSLAYAAPLVSTAFAAAAERSCELVLVHAWGVPAGYESLVSHEETARAITDHRAAALRDIAEQVAPAYPAVGHRVEVAQAHPARLLHDAAEDAQLLVIARRPNTFRRGRLGGTAHALLRALSHPLQVVPTSSAP